MTPIKYFPLTVSALLALGAPLTLIGCSDSSPDAAESTAADDIDTSYLDQLESEQSPPPAEPENTIEDEPVEIAQNSTSDEIPEDEEREWHAERGSKSTLGRTRDRARDLTNRLKDGTQPAGGIADTYPDEDYASTSGYRWELPDEWRMAVPVGDRFAEMFINSAYGSASVSFSKESGSVQDITRSLASILVTDSGGRNRADTTKKTVLGIPVTVVDMTGTYIDPAGKGGRNESPFYAMHAVIFELPNTRVLINMWGPEDTVAQNKSKFDSMISDTTKE